MITPDQFPEEANQPEERRLPFKPTDLNGYLGGQFDDAFEKEEGEFERGVDTPNGSFWQEINTPIGPEETRDTQGIIMKLPHPHDRAGSFWQVIRLHGRFDEEAGEFVHDYVLRKFEDDIPGPLFRTVNGGLAQLDEPSFQPKVEPEPTLHERAYTVYADIRLNNIVSSSE